ncbi:Cytochrome P450 E-class group I [Penicillium nucicola]|uniref:Cytochrome P450 E-class group I n=1 Tax=Penicillium nucicola TaxID=1850975 RepID=UPI0025459A9F|nr:Cytochrome P450 E-class group I [Penicillium nucicola]KAJ5757214.1 Cytochrome P450 E-class group I [Penicillium nucicola]
MAWMPGGGFQRMVQEWGRVLTTLAERPYAFTLRICPGRFLTIFKSLTVFDISKRIGIDGKEVDLPAGFLPGIISHPIPFQVNIRPRTEHCEMLIDTIKTEDPWMKGDSDIFDAIGPGHF